MSIRSMLRGLSERTGIKFETLRNRWKSGYREAELVQPVGEITAKRSEKPPCCSVKRQHALPVRVPDSYRYR